MKNPSCADQDDNLWVVLSQAREVVSRAIEKESRQYGITGTQATVLGIIQAIGDKATPAEISRWLLREPHSVSEILGRMEREGLVRKVKDLDRKNLVRVVLTEKGQRVCYQSIRGESMRRITSSLSEEDRQQLRSRLETLRDKAVKELGLQHQPSSSPSR